ncbi:O-antigen ligase family protein [Pseudalkalibacillus hwajinpoensis]|uniref:O-antigen ligase family protein n=1 Tax=Guptibacillus hwajinpoensis TaxID=208199 RepID=A0A4U1MHM8_9BACL|nr:O-antigen ligase family protein [Pseudalkalibacillus hwajinpoensis]TKD70809.1 O-antigen ligase family protein [Pseudalkalibacillus hwajinpoensis]
MKMELTDTQFKQRTNIALFVLIVLVTMGRYNIYVGFAIKPYMILCLLFFCVHILSFRFYRFHLFEIFFFLFYFIYMYSGAFALYSLSSFRMVFGIVLYMICYVIIKDIIGQTKDTIIESAIGYAGIVFNIVSLILYVIGLKLQNFVWDGDGITSVGVLLDRGYPRLIGLLQDPNFFVFYNTLFFAYFLCHRHTLKNKVGLFLCLTTSILTFSRGGLVALILIFLLYAVTNKPKEQLKLIGGVIASLGIMAYIAIVELKFDVFSLVASRVDDLSSDGGSGRFELWGRAIDYFSSHMVLGLGAFNFSDYNLFDYGEPHYVHNTFLEILSDSGITGLFFYLLFILIVFVQLLQSRLYRTKPYLFLTFIGFLLQMVSLSLVINDMFFLFMAILSAYLSQTESRTSDLPVNQSARLLHTT